jgi:hypothetical protein
VELGMADSAAFLGVSRLDSNGDDVLLQAVDVSAIVGNEIPNGAMVRARITGSSPTRIRAKVWRADQAEPPTWTIDRSDSAGPQAAGAMGLAAFSDRVQNLVVAWASIVAFDPATLGDDQLVP